MSKYVITQDSISFFHEDRTNLINKQDGIVFELIKNLLKADNFCQAFECTTYEGYIKVFFPGLEKVKNEYYYNGVSLENLTGCVDKFIKEGLPLNPLLKFVSKTDELEPKLRSRVRSLVASSFFPITWEGDLVAYKRSSWNANELTAPEFSSVEEYRAAYAEFKQQMFEDIFVPFKYVGSTKDDGLLVSSFNWVAASCPDQGAFYDVKVSVQDIISCTPTGLVVKGYTNLSRLSESYARGSTGTLMTVNLSTNLYGETVLVKQPFTIEEARSFLLDTFNGCNTTVSEELQSVPVSVSC